MLRIRYSGKWGPKERGGVFDPETVAFLEGGCSIIAATVGPDGMPHASRAWAITVLDKGDPAIIRLTLNADETVAVDQARAGNPIAITATSVMTMHSRQLKGRVLDVLDVLDVTDADIERVDQHCEKFFADIHTSEHTDLALLERLRPDRFVVCTVAVDTLFDQTPGPGAGRDLGTKS
jgi:hypothetical protein